MEFLEYNLEMILNVSFYTITGEKNHLSSKFYHEFECNISFDSRKKKCDIYKCKHFPIYKTIFARFMQQGNTVVTLNNTIFIIKYKG